VWCLTPVIPAFGRLRQEDWEFKCLLGYIARPCLEINKGTKFMAVLNFFMQNDA
jgi:hypothetical protein